MRAGRCAAQTATVCGADADPPLATTCHHDIHRQGTILFMAEQEKEDAPKLTFDNNMRSRKGCVALFVPPPPPHQRGCDT